MLEQFFDEDYKKMTFPIFGLSSDDSVFRRFPKLQSIKSFTVQVPLVITEKIIRYVLFMYDVNTPLHQIDSIPERKIAASKLAFFPKNEDGGIDEAYMDILACKNVLVNKMIVDYCRYTNGPTWSTLMMLEEVFSKAVESALLSGGSSAVKQVNDLRKDLSNVRLDFLSEDNTHGLVSSLNDLLYENSIDYSPEGVLGLVESSGGQKIFPQHNQTEEYL
jgi:hypothetical protein